jgi:hypothetical protein
MTIRRPNCRNRQRGMNLQELLVFILCVGIAFFFSGYMHATHNLLVGIVALPFGFCAAACIIGLLGEVAVRYGYYRAGRTPGALIRRSLIIGVIFGLFAGVGFLCLGLSKIIPTIHDNRHWLLLSACLFGTSVTFTVAFINMVRRDGQKTNTKNVD